MYRNKAILLMTLFLLLFLTWEKSLGEQNTHKISSSSSITLELIPIMHEGEWVKSFTARIKNNDTKSVTIAHPAASWPEKPEAGVVKAVEDLHGKSEILLEVTKPDGSKVILRDGTMHYFDPGNSPCLNIEPGKTDSFHVGWFFQNARGRWENDLKAWKVFEDKGTYKVRIFLRNAFSHAIYNYEEGNTLKVKHVKDVWTGEVESDEVAVLVK